MGLRCAFPRPDLNVMHSRERAGIDRDWSSCLFSSLLLSFSRQWRDFRPSLDHRFARSPHLLSWPFQTPQNLMLDYLKLKKLCLEHISRRFCPTLNPVFISEILFSPCTIYLAPPLAFSKNVCADQKHLSTLPLKTDSSSSLFSTPTPIHVWGSKLEVWSCVTMKHLKAKQGKLPFTLFWCHLRII